MKCFLIFFFYCLSISLYSQASQLWDKEIGGGEDDWGYSICLSHDNAFAFTGVTSSNDEEIPDSIGGTDLWIGKIDTDSNMIWSFTYGGTLDDRGNSLSLCSDNGFIATGFSYSNDTHVINNHGGKDLFLIKTNSLGELEWSKLYGGSSDDIGNSVIQSNDGNFIVVGTTFSSDGDIQLNKGFADYWIIKIDTNGVIVWEKTYGGSNEDRAKKIIPTSDGNYVIIGTSFSSDGDVNNPLGGVDFWLLKINPHGDLIWEKSFGGSSADQGFDVIETSNGELVIVGEVLSNDINVMGNHGLTDAWVAKLDANGNLLWQNSLGGTKVDYFLAVKNTNDLGFIATGNTFSDDGDVEENLGASDVWLVKLNKDGELEWEITLGYNLNEIGNDLVTIDETTLIIGGIQVDHLRHGNTDAYVTKIRSPLTSILNIQPGMNIKIYPNPSSGILHFENDLPVISYIIYNQLGEKVFSKKLNDNQFLIDISHLTNGQYFIHFTLKNKQELSTSLSIFK